MTAYNGTISTPVTGTPRWQAGQTYTSVGTHTINGVYAQNDTITWAGLIPNNGVEVQQVRWSSNELDTNATPTATVNVGTAASGAAFISGLSVGLSVNGANQVVGFGNVIAGIGSVFTATTDVVANFTAAFATAANTTHSISCAVTYYCIGES